MLRRILTMLLLSCFLLTGCSGKNKPIASLDIDLYLHPEAARGDDLLLQSAIEAELRADNLTRGGIIHTRVIQGIVFLSGTAQTVEVSRKAEEIAGRTEVAVNGRAIKTQEKVRNQLEVAP
jgi:osmotically-inducible protein OsmY